MLSRDILTTATKATTTNKLPCAELQKIYKKKLNKCNKKKNKIY